MRTAVHSVHNHNWKQRQSRSWKENIAHDHNKRIKNKSFLHCCKSQNLIKELCFFWKSCDWTETGDDALRSGHFLPTEVTRNDQKPSSSPKINNELVNEFPERQLSIHRQTTFLSLPLFQLEIIGWSAALVLASREGMGMGNNMNKSTRFRRALSHKTQHGIHGNSGPSTV